MWICIFTRWINWWGVYEAITVSLWQEEAKSCVRKLKKPWSKQAPKAWNCALSSFLISYGFQNSIADKALFIFKDGKTTAYIKYWYIFIISWSSKKHKTMARFEYRSNATDVSELTWVRSFLSELHCNLRTYNILW